MRRCLKGLVVVLRLVVGNDTIFGTGGGDTVSLEDGGTLVGAEAAIEGWPTERVRWKYATH